MTDRLEQVRTYVTTHYLAASERLNEKPAESFKDTGDAIKAAYHTAVRDVTRDILEILYPGNPLTKVAGSDEQ